MNAAFEVSAAALRAGQRALEIYANNVANLNTPAFKRTEVRFSEVLANEARKGDTVQTATPELSETGGGVRIVPQNMAFAQGELRSTGNTMDLAIEGQGLIELVGPGGEPLYWRGGTLRVNEDGALATADAFPLRAGIVVPKARWGRFELRPKAAHTP